MISHTLFSLSVTSSVKQACQSEDVPSEGLVVTAQLCFLALHALRILTLTSSIFVSLSHVYD